MLVSSYEKFCHDNALLSFGVFIAISNSALGADQFYAKDAIFEDPIGKHTGRGEIKKYYAGLYKNVTAIRFEFTDLVKDGDRQVAI